MIKKMQKTATKPIDYLIDKWVILSLIFLLLGYISTYLLKRFMPIPVIPDVINLSLFGLAFLFSYISLILAKDNKYKRKYGFVRKFSLLASVILIMATLPGVTHSSIRWQSYKRPHRVPLIDLYLCLKNFTKSNNGMLPDKEFWCDKLNIGKYYDKKSFCYAINENVCSRVLKELPENTVLAFNTSVGWNLVGGRELLMKQSEKVNTEVLLANGEVVPYKFSKRDESNHEVIIEQDDLLPCWEVTNTE